MSDQPTDTTQTSVDAPVPNTPVVIMPNINNGTLRASVIIGTKSSIAAELERYFGGTPYYRLDPSVSFRDQLDRIWSNSKYKNSHYVYGMVAYGCSIPEDKLDEEMKKYPKGVREYRVQRVKIHAKME